MNSILMQYSEINIEYSVVLIICSNNMKNLNKGELLKCLQQELILKGPILEFYIVFVSACVFLIL